MSFETRAEVIRDRIAAGMTEKDLWEEDFSFMVKHHRGINTYLRMVRPERIHPPKVEAFIGMPGTGKTRFVHDFARIFFDGDLWTWAGDRWFDGYAGQKVALFDDFRGEIPLAGMLKALDRYDNQQPIKGGFVWFNPVRIFITSNEPPESWYPDAARVSIDALRRRIRFFLVNEPVY